MDEVFCIYFRSSLPIIGQSPYVNHFDPFLCRMTVQALGVKMMECDCTDYAFAVRDGLQRVVQYHYNHAIVTAYRTMAWS
jgi:hypothetical protein